MARRRYLSSAISTDKIVNRLALDAGDFAALLYTWMIPHAADNATVSGDPEELLMQVFPGRRDKEPSDIAAALAAMAKLGLITWEEGQCVHFPASFYKHQTYISADRRDVAETAQNAADQRRSAQSASSLKSSLEFKSSSPAAPLPPKAERNAAQPPPPSKYEQTLNGAMPKIEALFQGIDAEVFTASWLRGVLRDAEPIVGPLSRDQLGRGLNVAMKEMRKRMAAEKPPDHPRPYARKLIVDYLTEQRDEHHAA